MEIILLGKSINIVKLGMISILYLITISFAMCETINLEKIKNILALFLVNTDEKEGFMNLLNSNSSKNQRIFPKFEQNKYIHETKFHELNENNANYKNNFDPSGYNKEDDIYKNLTHLNMS